MNLILSCGILQPPFKKTDRRQTISTFESAPGGSRCVASTVELLQETEDLRPVSQKVKKELERIYQCFMSMTSVYLCHGSKGGEAQGPVDCKAAIEVIRCASLEERPMARENPKHIHERHERNEKAHINAFVIFSKVLETFPSPAWPVVYRELSVYKLKKLKKELALDSGAGCLQPKPSSFQHKRREGLFHKSGLDRPSKTLNLARDDLATEIYGMRCAPALSG